jgi:hypothetical protein
MTTGDASRPVGASVRVDNAGSLAGNLSAVSPAWETTTVTRVASPTTPPTPPADQEVGMVFHPIPFRFSFDPPGHSASVSTYASTYTDLPRHHGSVDNPSNLGTHGLRGRR